MGREGLQTYYTHKIEELEVVLREKEQNVRRLEAQRNEWNAKGSNLNAIFVVVRKQPLCSICL